MRRLLVLSVGAGLLLLGLPVLAPPAAAASVRGHRDAVTVLERAVRAARVLDYSGTQQVATWSSGTSTAARAAVTHRSGSAAVVAQDAPGSGPVGAATSALDERHLRLLADGYDLSVGPAGRCTGRRASIVEARRPGGQLAGRLWIDDDSGLLLRREVYDSAGRPVRSSAYVSLDVRRASAGRQQPPRQPVGEAAVLLRAQGWHVPDTLPDGFRLFDVRLSQGPSSERVLHLAYSDGLSTTSLFAQPGQLRTAPAGFTTAQVGDRRVWVRHEAPERVVWGGGGRVWTLVSDAPAQSVQAALAVLPAQETAPREGVSDRLARGAHRLAGLLNPFD